MGPPGIRTTGPETAEAKGVLIFRRAAGTVRIISEERLPERLSHPEDPASRPDIENPTADYRRV